jgi:hypothetical protein
MPFEIIAFGAWPTKGLRYQNALHRIAAYLPIEIQP